MTLRYHVISCQRATTDVLGVVFQSQYETLNEKNSAKGYIYKNTGLRESITKSSRPTFVRSTYLSNPSHCNSSPQAKLCKS